MGRVSNELGPWQQGPSFRRNSALEKVPVQCRHCATSYLTRELLTLKSTGVLKELCPPNFPWQKKVL